MHIVHRLKKSLVSIGYGGNVEAYMTPARTLFDSHIRFVYGPFEYPSVDYALSLSTQVSVYHKERQEIDLNSMLMF